MPQQALRPAGLHRQGVVVEHCGLAYSRKLARNWTTCLEDRCSYICAAGPAAALLWTMRAREKRSNKAS